MCLSRITNENPKKTGVGYKVFYNGTEGLIGEIQGDDLKTRPYNKWLLAKDFSYGCNKFLESDTWEPYRSGWHIFKNLKHAKIWKNNSCPFNDAIKKVKYRNAIVCGNQVIWHSESITKKSIRGDVVVADEIYIYKKEIK